MTQPVRSGEEFATMLLHVDRLLAASPEESSAAPRKYTDVVADLLAFLAQRMTELHERRQAEIRQFLAWMEEQLDCGIDTLAGKTTLRDYYRQADGADALLAVIERNCPSRTRLDVRRPRGYGAINPERERIIQGYGRSMHVLRPLLLQLELTDRLIDELVYRLYGLTPAEIALVAGGGKTAADDLKGLSADRFSQGK